MGNALLAGARAFVAAAAAAALVSCNGGSGGKSAQQNDTHARVGSVAPNWTQPTTLGSKLNLASLRGKAIYLNFFATWCPPCNEEAPAIEKLQRDLGPRGLQVVGIDVLENARKAAEFQHTHGIDYPVVVDDGTLRDQYLVDGLPVHVFIDRAGVIRKVVVGELSPEQMRANVLVLLQ